MVEIISEAPETSVTPAAWPLSILLVDDDASNRLALSEILADSGADIVCASSGKEALKLILQRDFAVILLDVRMPDMDGYETATYIRQRQKSRHTPIIFLTAVHKDEAHVFRGYSTGAVDYVFKPIEPVVLRAKVAAFIELYKQAEEIRRQAEHERRLLEENLRIRTAKIEAEYQLRSSEARQALIIRSLPIALYEAQLAEEGIVRSFVHDNVVRLLGFEASAFKNDTTLWASRVHPDDWPMVVKVFENARKAGDYAVQYRWKCANGSYRYFLDQGVAMGGNGSELPRIFGTMLDVHDQRMLEQQLVHAQKMDAIGQLTGGIAHDFSNMLMVIIGNLDRIRRGGQVDESTAALLDLALQGAMHCRDMTKRLVAFARQQALLPKYLDLNDLINDLADMLDRTLGEGISIKKNLAKSLWPVFVDPVQVEAAIVNLVMNARDAMPRGGSVTIKTANTDVTAELRVGLNFPPGAYVMLEVIDTGVGMAPEVLARAVEPFFTTKEIGRGTGLGLSTTYGFVRQSGGDLIIESEPNKGTTVRIYLPRREMAPGDVRKIRPRADRSEVPRARNKELILVVEDDAKVRRTATGLLRDLGYRVIEAEQAADALDILGRRKDVALLFTDLVMPGPMNGYQLAQEAQRRRSNLKILYTSAHAGDRIFAVSGSALQPLLRKPYRDHELARAVRDALR
jgi:CheY-like chemotaxis protein